MRRSDEMGYGERRIGGERRRVVVRATHEEAVTTHGQLVISIHLSTDPATFDEPHAARHVAAADDDFCRQVDHWT